MRQELDADDLAYESAYIASAPPPQRQCPTGKFGFRSQSKAANVAKNMRHHHRDPFVEPYQCGMCNRWHVGHAPGTKRARVDLLHQAASNNPPENPR